MIVKTHAGVWGLYLTVYLVVHGVENILNDWPRAVKLFFSFLLLCFVSAVCVQCPALHCPSVVLHVVCVYTLFSSCVQNIVTCCVCLLFLQRWSFPPRCSCWSSLHVQTWLLIALFGAMLYPLCAISVCACVSHSESVWILSQTVLWYRQKS